MKLDLRPGDVFGTNLNGLFGWAIKKGQAVKSNDCHAGYSHNGIILSPQGQTFEALWTIKRQNLFEAYNGTEVIIARWTGMTPENFANGFSAVSCQEGRLYPGFRLILHLLNAAKIHVGNQRMVCSENTAYFLINAGAKMMCGQNPYGVTPDNNVDEWRISRYFDIIFEGKLNGNG
jgi:hypothetical protein